MAALADIRKKCDGRRRRQQTVLEILVFKFVARIEALKLSERRIQARIGGLDAPQISGKIVARRLGAGSGGTIPVITPGAQVLVLRREFEPVRRANRETERAREETSGARA